MAALIPHIRDLRRGPSTPSPAAPAGREDGGQRYLKDTSEARLSDKYPAGLTFNISRETLRSSDSEARSVVGRGVAVSGGSPASVQPRDSIRAAVPARGMEPRGGRNRRASSTQARRDVSLDVRLSKAEREAIRARARTLRVKPSAWSRAVMLDAIDARGTREVVMQQNVHETPAPELAGAVEQLRRIGVNLNQALRKGQSVDVGLLRAVFDAVNDVRAALGDRTAS